MRDSGSACFPPDNDAEHSTPISVREREVRAPVMPRDGGAWENGRMRWIRPGSARVDMAA